MSYHSPRTDGRASAVDITFPTRQFIDVKAMTKALEQVGPIVQQFATHFGRGLDEMRHRLLVTNLMRAMTYEEAVAISYLKRAKRITNGRRRHGMVKHRRDELRQARRAAR